MFGNQQSFLTSAQIKAQMEALQAQLAIAEEAEKSGKKIIDEIKKSKIDPKALTALLIAEKLIVMPEGTKTDKEVIYSTNVTTKTGRSGTFQVWADRPVWNLTADAKTYWQSIKQAGKEDFIAKANNAGKAYVETEAGKTWLAKAFA